MHHVYARGAKQAVIYRDDEDRSRYLAMLGRAVVDQGLRCLSYCLMDNHVHLVIETPRANLGVGMHRAHGPFAQSFNRRHGTSGHVFQGRYNAKRVRSDAQFWTLAAYVARNPVAAGLCERPEQWRWSSHAATLGVGGVAPAWLDVGRTLELFSSAGGDPRERYAAFVGA